MLRRPKLIRDQEGSVAVEFALVGGVFIVVILFVMASALILYINQTLDNATAQASRQILTGSLQSQSTAATLTSFKKSLCGYLPPAFPCDDVIVNLYVVPKAVGPSGYYSYVTSDQSGVTVPNLTTGSGQLNMGGRGDYQYLQVIYPITLLPAPISSWLSGGATYKGKPAYLAISAAAFRNEQY